MELDNKKCNYALVIISKEEEKPRVFYTTQAQANLEYDLITSGQLHELRIAHYEPTIPKVLTVICIAHGYSDKSPYIQQAKLNEYKLELIY